MARLVTTDSRFGGGRELTPGFDQCLEVIVTLLDPKPIAEDKDSSVTGIADVVVDLVVTVFDVVLVQELLIVSSLEQGQLSPELRVLVAELGDDDLGIHALVFEDAVLYAGDSPSELASRNSLGYVSLLRTNRGHHLSLAVASERVPQDHREQRLTIGYDDVFSLHFVAQTRYDPFQEVQGQVDVPSLVLHLPFNVSVLDSFRPGQIHQMDSAGGFDITARFFYLNDDLEDTVGPG